MKKFLAWLKSLLEGKPKPPEEPPEVPDGPEGFDLSKVTWVHGVGQSIASWPILCELGAVRFEPPYVVTTGAAWPAGWPTVGAKKAQASHVVLACVDGKWYGGCWEAMRRGMGDRRPLEGLTKPQPPGRGPFCQVERDPFWNWKPVKGEWIGFMITSWIRSGVAQPVGRSRVVWTKWP